MAKKIIQPKFRLNEDIWYTGKRNKSKKPKCKRCEGDGDLFTKSNKKVTCDACNGNGYIFQTNEIETPKKATIKEIILTLTGYKYNIGKKHDPELCLYWEEELFRTQKETKEFIKKKNKKR